MAKNSGKKQIVSRDTAAFPLFIMIQCIIYMIMSMIMGTDTMFYAGIPLCLTLSVLLISVIGKGNEIGIQISNRLKKNRYNDAMLMYKVSVIESLIGGLIMLILYTLCAELIAHSLFGIRNSYLVLYSLAPAVLFGSFIGPFRGILNAVGFKSISRISLYIMTAASSVASVIFAILMSDKGEKTGALLQNSGYKAVYTAAGIGMGMSLGVIITFAFLLVMTRFAKKYIRQREDSLRIDNEENTGELFFYFLKRMLPYAVVFIVPTLVIIIDYKFYLGTLVSSSSSTYHSEWGGFIGITFPFILMIMFAISLLFIGDINKTAVHFLKEENKKMRLRFSMVMRISGYYLIPAVFFIFGAAKPFVNIFRNGLYGKAMDGAVLPMKLGSPVIFLFSTSLLIGILFWQTYYNHIIMAAMIFAGVIQTIAMYALVNTDLLGLESIGLALDLFGAAFLILVYFLGKRELLSGCRMDFIIDDLMCGFCAFVAMVPVELLNDVMTDSIPSLIGIIILFVIFYAVYIVMTILLKCVDLGNIHLIPGGVLIENIAALLVQDNK